MSGKLRKRILLLVLVVGVGALALAVLLPPRYHAVSKSLPASFDDYFKQKLQESKEKGARPGNDEKLIRFADKTEFAILYIHGYGASRAEGEYVVDQLAEKFKANTYYMRLPGHGTNVEDHASATFSDYINAAEEAYQMTKLLGDHVIIVGTSMGGLLTTYLASRHPEIAGVVLASPFYDFTDPRVHLANEPAMIYVLEGVNGGPIRKSESKEGQPDNKWISGHEDFWLQNQYVKAVISLENLREYAANTATYEKVTVPVLMLYYYKDEEHQDPTASVPAMLDAFAKFGTAEKPNPLNRAVAIEDGEHVLLSKWLHTDHERALKEMTDFLSDVRNQIEKK